MDNTSLRYFDIQDITHLKVHGRTNKKRSPLPIFFNGGGIEINISGAECWITFDVNYTTFEPWITIEINGECMSRQMLLKGKTDICLFRGMNPDQVKNVKVTRELQAMSDDVNNHLWVCGLYSDGSFYPVAEKHLTIEFIGDSITSGEGTYGHKEDVDWIPMYMGYSRNYAKFVSEALDAEPYLISQGGWGVLSSWDNCPSCNIPSKYEKVCGLCCGPENEQMGAMEPYDFTQRKVDAVIVNLGTNDASAFEQPMWQNPVTGESFKQRKEADGTYNKADLKRFENAVTDFLKMIRINNPKAHIVWCYGMLGYPLSFAINEAMLAYKEQTGDENVIFLQMPNTTAETVGSHTHPGEKSHRRAAKVIIEYLEAYFQL